jgi:crotonobetainyl-CoA:carnitine CoA-transferase CaiB-like acyl-CoA transferase
VVVDLVHPQAGHTRAVGCPVHFSTTSTAVTRPAPLLGEHIRLLLRDNGYSEDEVDRFVADGVVEGQRSP